MKQIAIISGKGGTGKTVIAGAFAAIAKNKVMVDCDVDAADLHLLLDPEIEEAHLFKSGETAFIDKSRCTQCGRCIELCRFDAVKEDFSIDTIACEGCALCSFVCPDEAIEMIENISGEWFISDTRFGPMVHAKLGIAEENSGKLVSLVKGKAKGIAETKNLDWVIIDGPPGIGCPVISSLSGASLALLVTEPTLSGIHDLERVLGVCHHFKIPALVCINKYDLNEENTRRIEDYTSTQGVEVISRIPFDSVITEAIAQGLPVVEHSHGRVTHQIELLWQSITRALMG